MEREAELELLLTPDKWPHKTQMPLKRRGGNIVFNDKDAGIVLASDILCVWTGVYLGEGNPCDGVPVHYESLDKLLDEWEIDLATSCRTPTSTLQSPLSR